MAVSRTAAYKLEKRQYYKTTTREGMFVADFVKTKYPEIYQESATLYNRINQSHPNKPNLRKTIEYRMWKNEIAIANNQPTRPIPRQRNQLNKHLLYPNMPTGPTTTENITLQPDSSDETTTENITLQSDSSDETATENITLQPDSSDETATENTPGPSSQKETHQLADRQMVLTIPLMPYPTTPKSIQTPTKILETAYTESIVEEGDQQEILDPSLIDVVPADVVEKIIAELQQDPCLKDIMLDMEKQLTTQEELVGLEVDVPDIYDPLEEELENMYW